MDTHIYTDTHTHMQTRLYSPYRKLLSSVVTLHRLSRVHLRDDKPRTGKKIKPNNNNNSRNTQPSVMYGKGTAGDLHGKRSGMGRNNVVSIKRGGV